MAAIAGRKSDRVTADDLALGGSDDNAVVDATAAALVHSAFRDQGTVL